MSDCKLECRITFRFFKFWVYVNAIPIMLFKNWDFYVPNWAIKLEVVKGE